MDWEAWELGIPQKSFRGNLDAAAATFCEVLDQVPDLWVREKIEELFARVVDEIFEIATNPTPTKESAE